SGFDGVDTNDRAAETLLVGAHAGGQIGQRRFATHFATERFARGLELTALAADAARPGILAQRVDHRPADAPFGERLELDASGLVEAVRRVDQADDPVLDEIPDINRVRHGRGNATGELL